MGLLTEIETCSTSSTVPIVDILRKCKVLAARLSHKEFGDWVTNELNGYTNEVDIPEYRRITYAPPIGDFQGAFGSALKNYPIPMFCVPEQFREKVQGRKLNEPVATVEEFASTAGGCLQYTWNGDFISLMQRRKPIYEGMALVHASSQISTAQLKGVVDSIRTRILDYVLAIQIQNPDADSTRPGEIPPISKAVLHQTFHTTIVGGQANIGGQGSQSIAGTNQNTGENNETIIDADQVVRDLLGQLKSASSALEYAEQAELDAALGYVEAQFKTKKPDVERIKSYLDIAGKLANLAPVAEKLYHYVLPLLPKV